MTITQRLERAHPALFIAFAGLASFSAYFAMYAFRKPFAAATFDHVAGWHFALLDYKSALVIAQVLGYALSKVMGIKLISEMGPSRRAVAIIGLIATSWLALVLFALVPAPWNVPALFLNGLPLGLIWGLVYGYVEGRRTSEVIGAILCASFILSSGVVKSAGRWLLDQGVSDLWMPAATGALFFPVLLIAVYGLTLLPPPNAQDQAERAKRAPMNSAQRGSFLRRHIAAIVPLVAAYVLLTAMRDFRDNFAAEIWTALGYRDVAAMFTASEVPVALFSLVTLGALMAVRDNMRALLFVHGAIVAGAVVVAAATFGYQAGRVNPALFMILTGAGLYMAYVPFNAILFDRIIAATREVGTAGFLIYVADSSGYAGSVGLLLFRDFFAMKLDWLRFFETTTYCTAVGCIVGATLSALHFARLRVAAPEPAAA
ncbi:MAG: hypothetical protein ISS15_09035 [Alphaproteobacteria bacterium]|nr:hypothetical protein [Alphaproteobacteria bacterium]MBL6937020.1 hypothetical protein [Alphaproteobacteria bacterium]MBL7097789.1 hypothetical protein [Alphaproteobacteria bacterium]